MAKRVLIADDALFMRNLLRDIFEPAGWEIVAEAATGLEAVAEFNKHLPELVTMDIVMPEMGGIDALKQILADHPAARIIMCSALGQETLIMEALTAGAIDFIVKPFQDEQVLEIVERVSAQKD